ncbi:MAG: MerR family transcriptional regulator, partial [Spirochaetota bacterium]
MYSIGEFSQINRITPKTLRHYDRIGLLEPARTDEWTGYRYYSPAQLPMIRRILALKDLGFSLEEIGRIVRGEV